MRLRGGEMFDFIVALILTIAANVGVPPYFALAVAIEENHSLNPNAVSPVNQNGTVDLGVMQLNSAYYGDIEWQDPTTNILAGCLHIKGLMDRPEVNTYWTVAVAYNCGLARFFSEEGPPAASLSFGDRVIRRWLDLAGMQYINPVINRGRVWP